MNGNPKLQGSWAFTIGHYCLLKRDPFGSGHLCQQCHDQVKVLMETFWRALFPALEGEPPAREQPPDDDIPF
jgi:hypothetical protein